MQKEPVLNIHMYSFDEILGLFDLSYDISPEDMKRAKKKVLMLHPDKSKLPPDYFLFYKKALDIVFNYYQNNNKQNQSVTPESTQYKPQTVNDFGKNTDKQITSVIQNMSKTAFQEKFNELFEQNMMQKNTNNQKNEWFHKEDPLFEVNSRVNANNLGQAIESIREKNQSLVKHQGIQQLYTGSGTNFYEDEMDDTENDTYVTSDPFGKLKYDDLRKVHKDQTVFAVSEKDYSKIPQYKNVEQYNRTRGQQDLTPLEKTHAEKMLQEQDRILREKMARKQYESTIRTQKYEEKNKSVLSTFLQLKN